MTLVTNRSIKRNLLYFYLMQPGTGGSVSRIRTLWLLSVLLAIIAFGIYANTLQNGYVLDDGMVLQDNVFIKRGIPGIPDILTTLRLKGVELTAANDFYRPLSMVMFAIEVQFFGMNPVAGHFFNILTFIGCVLLLFFFLDKLLEGKRTRVAFIAAFLFAIHPIHTEVVANIKSRDELLCYFLSFLSLNLFMNYMAAGKTKYQIFGSAALLLAYLSKETVIAFVAILPLIFFFYHNHNRRRAIFITSGAVIATTLFLILRMLVINKYQAGAKEVDFMENALIGAPDISSRYATAILVLGKYLKILFVPYPLLCNYSFSSIPFVGFANVWVLLTLFIYGVLIAFSILTVVRKQKNYLAFAGLFYLFTLALFSNIPFLVGAQMAERFLFFPSTGFCLAVALIVEKWVPEEVSNKISGLKQPKVLAVLTVFLLLFGGMTVARNREWKSNYTLYSADILKAPEDSRLNFWLAAEISQNLRNKEPDTIKQKIMDRQSISYLRRAIDIYPDFPEALADLAWIYQRNGIMDSARYYNAEALRRSPDNSAANNNMGNLYMAQGKYREAIVYLNRAIAGNPKFKGAYMALANCYLQTGRYEDAIANCNKVLELDADYTDAHQALGNVYMRLQHYDLAEQHFVAVIKIKPGYVYAINNLGVIYLNSRRFTQAIEQFSKVIATDPNYATAYSNMGRAYYFTSQYSAAIDIINKKMKLTTNVAEDIPILALCYQKIGNSDLARKYEALAQKRYPDFKLE